MKAHYITFAQAKWLKEKKFNEWCNSFYNYNKKVKYGDSNFYSFKRKIKNYNSEVYKRPEQWLVVEWLRVNHGIWVEARHIKTFGVNRFHLIIWKYDKENFYTIHCDNSNNGMGYKVWDTPQEAYSAAFDYILQQNLI
jgi:hypothetical protein